MFINRNLRVDVLVLKQHRFGDKKNKLLDESTLKQVIDHKESKSKEDPLPLNHYPP